MPCFILLFDSKDDHNLKNKKQKIYALQKKI